jgi:hypothetical protein
LKFKALEAAEIIKTPNKDLDGNVDTPLLHGKDDENTAIEVAPLSYIEDSESQIVRPQELNFYYSFFFSVTLVFSTFTRV